MKRTLATLFLVGSVAAGCTQESKPSVATVAVPTTGSVARGLRPALDPAQILATIDGQAVTAKDVDTLITPQLDDLQKQFQAEQFGLRKQALDAVVVMRLVDTAAKSEGITEQAWLKKHVEGATPDATEADAKKFYDANSAQMAGQSFDKAKPKILTFLTDGKRREAAQKIFDGLKSKAKIEIKLKESQNAVADSR